MKKKAVKKITKQNFKDSIIIIFSLLTLGYIIFSLFKIITTTAPDFPSYYYATQDLLQQKNPYIDKNIPNIFIYPAATSLFYLPFLLFPYHIAQGIFVILSAISVPIIVYLSVKLIYKKFSWRHIALFSSFTFLSFPTKFTLGMGQINLLALLFLLIGYYFYLKVNEVKSSLAFGIAFLIKPILCFMLVFFFLRKEKRLICLIGITLLSLFGLSFLLYGTTAEWYYITSLVPSLLSSTGGREVYYNQGLLGFFARLTDIIWVQKVWSLGLILLLFGYTIFLVLKHKMHVHLQFALFLTLLPIVHTLSWQHYFVFLIFPYILITKKFMENKKYLFFIPLIISYLLISFTIKNPSSFMDNPMNFILSHTLFGACILLILLFIVAKTKKLNSFK